MTQELALWVLLAGLVGLVWVLTCAILPDDHSAVPPDSTEKDTRPEHNNQQRTASKPQRVAA